ncbi:MAG: hypothetical protein U9Q03_06470 [Patescibacteria group bacterium]|nr:hypothetical protein [Patescibacteria group bacterium]
MNSIVKEFTRFIIGILKALVSSIVIGEAKEYWKKNKKELKEKYGFLIVKTVLKAKFKRTTDKLGAVWKRVKGLGRRKKKAAKKPEAKIPDTPSAKRPEPRSPPAEKGKDATAAAKEVTASWLNTIRGHAATAVRLGRDMIDGKQVEEKNPEPEPPVTKPEPSPPKIPGSTEGEKPEPPKRPEAEPKPPKAPEPPKPPEPPEKVGDELSRRCEEIIANERKKRQNR